MAQRNEKVCTMTRDGMRRRDEGRFFGKPAQPNILARRVPEMVVRRTAWQ